MLDWLSDLLYDHQMNYWLLALVFLTAAVALLEPWKRRDDDDEA